MAIMAMKYRYYKNPVALGQFDEHKVLEQWFISHSFQHYQFIKTYDNVYNFFITQ